MMEHQDHVDGEQGRLDRRTLLKAASAAGIVWAAPLVTSATAHAACACTAVQFDGFDPALCQAATNSTTDWTFEFTPDTPTACNVNAACSPQGLNSLNGLCVFDDLVDTGAVRGCVDPGVNTATTYTPPAGCVVVAASVRYYDDTQSGCDLRFPCYEGTIQGNGTVTWPTVITGFTIAYRIVLCCN